jgi:enterobactin synthetase component D / holo-[acyl-carrier protein] synthase
VLPDRGGVVGQLLSGLPVATEETALAGPFFPSREDLAAVAGAAEKRRHEYLAGRLCARRALARLGIRDHILRAGADRAPIWPSGVTGSITHAGAAPDGFCGVAVARRDDLAAVGIDAELDRPLPDELIPIVLTPREQEALLRRPAPDRGRIAALTFSAKESVYKALAPLLDAFIDFQEAEIRFDLDADLRAGRFAVDVRLPAPSTLPPVAGRMLRVSGLILTSATLGPLCKH